MTEYLWDDKPASKPRLVWVLVVAAVLGWGLALVMYLYPRPSLSPPPAPSPSSALADGQPTATIFDPDEPTLPGGVRVLRHGDTDDVVALDAGRYGVWVSDTLRYQVDVPAGSEVFDGIYLNPGSAATGRNGIFWMDVAPEYTALPAHPCRDHSHVPVGPTAADLATALSKQPYLTVTKPTEETVGGMTGLLVTATVPQDADMSACQANSVDLITGGYSAEAGIVQRMWILDVDGARHIIHAKVDVDDTNADQHTRAMIEMVESITFNHR